MSLTSFQAWKYMMQVNTDSVALLHKAILETELINHCRTPAVVYAGRQMEYIHIKEWLEKRIVELKESYAEEQLE